MKKGAVGGRIPKKMSAAEVASVKRSIIKHQKKLGLPEAWKPPPELPKELGPSIDLLMLAKREVRRLKEPLSAAEAEVYRIEQHLIATFEKQKLNGARGKLASITLVHKDVPSVVDKTEFVKWMYEHGAADCCYGRAVEEGCRARWEAGEEIKGVEKFHKLDLSVHEVK